MNILSKLKYAVSEWASDMEQRMLPSDGKGCLAEELEEHLDSYRTRQADFKKKNPVKGFIYLTFPDTVEYCVRWLYDSQWWVLHRIHPKHRYHVIHTGLKPNYYDVDTLMLHANFKLLQRYVEEERHSCDTENNREQFYTYLKTNKDWQDCMPWFNNLSENRKEGVRNFVAYLAWVKDLYAKRDWENDPNGYINDCQYETAVHADELYRYWMVDRPKMVLEIDNLLDDKDHRKYWNMENALEDKDTEMLTLLIKVRKGLWT